MPKRKSIVKRILTPLIAAYAALQAVLILPHLVKGAFSFQEHRNFKIAKNVREVFDYLAQQTINEKSDMHQVFPLQIALETDGYPLGRCGADGMFGNDVRKSIRLFQNDQVLPVTGEADPQTISALRDEIMQDDETQHEMDQRLLEPFRRPEISAFMNELPYVLSPLRNWGLLVRPDIVGAGAYYMLTREGGMTIESLDAAEKVFPGCAVQELRDAFRHSQAVFQLYPLTGPGWAITIGDFNERFRDNPLEIMLMDIFNHRIAAKKAQQLRNEGVDVSNPRDLIEADIRSGKGGYVLHPFPLVPKDDAKPS